MPTYLLCLDAPLPELINRVARDAAAAVPALAYDDAREVADLLLRTRIRQTVNCGSDDACAAYGAQVFAGPPAHPGNGIRPCRLKAADATDLPWMFATTCADRLHPPPRERGVVERRLAETFRDVIAPVLRTSVTCGVSTVCRAEPTDPFSYF